MSIYLSIYEVYDEYHYDMCVIKYSTDVDHIADLASCVTSVTLRTASARHRWWKNDGESSQGPLFEVKIEIMC